MHTSIVILPLLCFVSNVLSSPQPETRDKACNCKGTKDGGAASKKFVCRDSRLGPKVLPKKLPLSGALATYDRFGSLTPGQWLANFTDSMGNFIYPPQNGFQLDTKGNAINGTMTLEPGTIVDRFGSEYGAFISAADAPYSQRALPPANLDTNPDAPDFPFNYHVYRVKKTLKVVGGPIAPWFSQPGLGAQFYLGASTNVMTLIDRGFLTRIDPSKLITTQHEKTC